MKFIRICIIVNVVIVSLSPCIAEPLLKVSAQPVSNRTIPLPFEVDDYKGTLHWGHEKITFTTPGGIIRWNAWTNTDYIAVAKHAMKIVENRAISNSRCNHFFAKKMPAGKTLTEIWHANGPERIQISFSPGPSGIWRAATYGVSAPYEWTITENAVKLGPENIASAMLHEATRTNGIGGGKNQYIAYQAENICGMQQFILNMKFIKKLGWQIKK